MTIETKIAELKALHPTLTKGVNDEVVVLDANEYEETITQWATNEITAEETLAAKEAAKETLLNKLGITADEARLLIGGN